LTRSREGLIVNPTRSRRVSVHHDPDGDAHAAKGVSRKERDMLESTRKRGVVSLLARPLLAGMLVVGAAAPSAALAAEDLFLKLTGIKGESTDAQHKNEIVLLSYSQSFTQPASAGGGIANCGVVKVTKVIDRSSPALIGAVLTARNIPTAVITFRNSGAAPFEYYKVTLTDVVIQAITQTDASPTDSTTILEQISIIGTTFKFEYTLPTATGSPGVPVVFAWDCAKNMSF
jgi:type VI secretion system secreted protein Hcp